MAKLQLSIMRHTSNWWKLSGWSKGDRAHLGECRWKCPTADGLDGWSNQESQLAGKLIGSQKIQINPGTEGCLCALVEEWPFCKPPLEGSAISLAEKEAQGDVPTTLLPTFPLSTHRRAETAEHLFWAVKRWFWASFSLMSLKKFFRTADVFSCYLLTHWKMKFCCV